MNITRAIPRRVLSITLYLSIHVLLYISISLPMLCPYHHVYDMPPSRPSRRWSDGWATSQPSARQSLAGHGLTQYKLKPLFHHLDIMKIHDFGEECATNSRK